MNRIKTQSNTKVGTLFGLGVGPGDPELLTLKSLRILQNAPVLAYPAAEGVPSFARSIVADFIDAREKAAEEIAIEMPMVAARFPAQKVYDKAAQKLSGHLDAGRDVAVLCEGDPFFYGSFMYLYERLKGPYETLVVPGVSSLMACASVAGQPLAARNDRFTVLTGPMDDEILQRNLERGQAFALMKVGRHLPRLKKQLDKAGLLESAVYVERAGLDNQRILPLADLREATAPYFSMILVHRRGAAVVETSNLSKGQHLSRGQQ